MPTHDLYLNFPIIWLVRTSNGVENYNMPVAGNDSDFKIYKNNRNVLEFVIRDNDRKPIDLTGKTLTINFFNAYNNQLQLQLPMTLVSALDGRARATILANQTVDWIDGYYDYSVNLDDGSGNIDLLFHDRDQRVKGFVELISGVTPQPAQAIETLGNTFSSILHGTPQETHFISGSVTADNQLGLTDGLHSVAAYFTEFSGKFWVQATLLNTPSTNFNDWFDIQLTDTNNFDTLSSSSGIKNYNFTVNAQWIRYVYLPDSFNTGSLDKVLLKN